MINSEDLAYIHRMVINNSLLNALFIPYKSEKNQYITNIENSNSRILDVGRSHRTDTDVGSVAAVIDFNQYFR